MDRDESAEGKCGAPQSTLDASGIDRAHKELPHRTLAVPQLLPNTLLPRESAAKRWLRRGFLRALGFLRPYRFPASHLDRILVIRPDHIGDVLLITPALRLLRRAFPESEITVLVGPWSEAVLAGNPDIDRLQTCRFPGYDRSQPQQGLRAYMQLRREAARLQAEEFQLALNLRTDFWWGATLAAFAGIPYVWGFDSPECAPFLTHAQPAQNNEHQAASNLRLVQAAAVIGAEVADRPYAPARRLHARR